MEHISETGIQPKRKSHWQQPKTHHDSIRKQLVVLATARQATIQEAAFLVYCNGLEGFLIDDLQAAVAQLCLTERPEGRSALPSLGEMVTACQSAAQHRHEAERAEKDRQSSAYREAHPEQFCTMAEVLETMREQVAVCERVYGKEFRKLYRGEERDMTIGGVHVRRFVWTHELGDVYREALAAEARR